MGRSISIEQYLGIVGKVVCQFWHKLPPAVRTWYDIDDMVSDCVIQVLRVKSKYSPSRGCVSTFIYTVARNHCKQIIESHMQHKRQAVLLYLDADVMFHNLLPARTALPDQRMRAKETFELLLSRGSDDLRQTLSLIMEGKAVSRTHIAALAPEVKRIVHQNCISINDVVFCLTAADVA